MSKTKANPDYSLDEAIAEVKRLLPDNEALDIVLTRLESLRILESKLVEKQHPDNFQPQSGGPLKMKVLAFLLCSFMSFSAYAAETINFINYGWFFLEPSEVLTEEVEFSARLHEDKTYFLEVNFQHSPVGSGIVYPVAAPPGSSWYIYENCDPIIEDRREEIGNLDEVVFEEEVTYGPDVDGEYVTRITFWPHCVNVPANGSLYLKVKIAIWEYNEYEEWPDDVTKVAEMTKFALLQHPND